MLQGRPGEWDHRSLILLSGVSLFVVCVASVALQYFQMDIFPDFSIVFGRIIGSPQATSSFPKGLLLWVCYCLVGEGNQVKAGPFHFLYY